MKSCAAFIFYSLFIFISGVPLANAQSSTPFGISSYVDFVKDQKLSAKEYILDLFERYDIVIFGEREHSELTQYHLLKDLFSDERFYNQVGDIFMEIGGSNFDEKINRYLLSPDLTLEQSNQRALEIQRDVSFYPLWDRYNYHYLLTSLYEINKNLPAYKKLKLHPTDIAVDWKEIKTRQEAVKQIYERQTARDSVMAANTINYINKNSKSENARKKYFFILNMPHATNGIWVLNGVPRKSTASYIIEQFPSTANILINMDNMKNMFFLPNGSPDFLPILDGKWDAAFEFLGVDDVGFDIKGSPLEKEPFENFLMSDSTLCNENVFTGYVFYKSIPGHEYVHGVPGIIDDHFFTELKRRNGIFLTSESDQKIRAYNQKTNKKPGGLSSYWQKVSYWSGDGVSIIRHYISSGSIDQTIQFILEEEKKGSNTFYNITAEGINQFAIALISMKKNDDAYKMLKFNTEIHPNSSLAYFMYGGMLMGLGKTEEAKKALEKALELDPENSEAKRIKKEMGW